MPEQDFLKTIKETYSFVEWASLSDQELAGISNAQLLESYMEWLLSLRINQMLGSAHNDRHALDLLAACADNTEAFKKAKGVSEDIDFENIEKHLVEFINWLNEQYKKTMDNIIDCQYRHTRALFRPEDREKLKGDYIEFNHELKKKIDKQKDLLFGAYRQQIEDETTLSQEKKKLRDEGLKVLFGKDKDNFLTRRMGYRTFYEITKLKLSSEDDDAKWRRINLYWQKLLAYENNKDAVSERIQQSKNKYRAFQEEIKGTVLGRLKGLRTETYKKLDELEQRRGNLLSEMMAHGTDLSKHLDKWEKEIFDLAVEHHKLMGMNGPIDKIGNEIDGLQQQLKQGGLTKEKADDLKRQISYWRRVRLQFSHEQETLATRLVILEQMIPMNAEFIAGEISNQYDLSIQHKMAKQQLELIGKIPKLPKALNVYCACFNFSFDLVLEIGRLVTDLSKTSYDDWEHRKKSTKVFGWVSKSFVGIHIPVVDDVLKKAGKPREIHNLTTQTTTGSLKLQLTVGLYFGYGASSQLSVKAGACLVYTAVISHDDSRNFVASFTLEIKGEAGVKFTKWCEGKVSLGLYKREEAFKFNDVFQWAAWLCHKWARLTALYTAWCNIIDTASLESDRFGTISESDKEMLLSAAEQIFQDNKKIKRTIEIVSELLTEEPHVELTLNNNVLTDLSITGGASVPGPFTGEPMKLAELSLNTSLIPEKNNVFSYRYEMVKGYRRAVEYKKTFRIFTAGGKISLSGWSLNVQFSNDITFKQKSMNVAIDLDGFLKGEPSKLLGEQFGKLIGGLSPYVLYAVPATLGVTFLACLGAKQIMKKNNVHSDKVEIVGGSALIGGVGSMAALSFAKPGETVKDMKWAEPGAESGANLIQSLLETILVIVISKAFNSKSAEWKHHLFGFPEKKQDNLALPFGLWECKLVQSKLDFNALPLSEQPTEVMYPTQWVIAFWRKYSVNQRKIDQSIEIPIPTPAGEFFVEIDLAASLELRRMFAERIEHNTFAYVMNIYDGLICRKSDKKQRPENASGEKLWKEFLEDNERNLFLLCMYAGCKDMGYKTKDDKKRYGSRVYYEVLIDSKSGIGSAAAFSNACVDLNQACLKNADQNMLSRFRAKHLSIKEIDGWISSNKGKFDTCKNTMRAYFDEKLEAKSTAEKKDWVKTTQYDDPFHFTANPVKLIKRTYRYVYSRGDRKLQKLGDKISPHTNKSILGEGMAFGMLVEELQRLDPSLLKQKGLGKTPLTETRVRKLMEQHGSVDEVRGFIEAQLKGPQDLLILVMKVTKKIMGKPMTRDEAMLMTFGEVEIQIEKRRMKKDRKWILGNYYEKKKTSVVWNKKEFRRESDAGKYAKRYNLLLNIDKALDSYHSIPWKANNFSDRIKALNQIISRIDTLLKMRPTTKRKKSILRLAEQAATEVGLFEKAKTLIVVRKRRNAFIGGQRPNLK